MATSGSDTWFYRYLAPPVREVLEEGPAGEQRLKDHRHAEVCVLFTDIRGFTALSRSIDADTLARTVKIHMAYQAQTVERLGGYVDNFTGDGLMALFEGEGMEARACQCALEIMEQSRCPPPSPEVRAVSIGIGVHSGSVVKASVGCDSWQVYTSVGEAVNIASRLCDHARDPDEILTSETVRQAVGTQASDIGVVVEPFAGSPPRDVDPALALYRLRRN